MDPQATFEAFCKAVMAGDLDASAEAERDYNAWILRGGFNAKFQDGTVEKLDAECDRFLYVKDGLKSWAPGWDCCDR